MSLRYLAGFITASYNPLKVPNAPTITTVTAGNTQLTVAFTAPSNVGGGAITSYIAIARTSAGVVTSATGSASPITITGLSNGTAYTVQVAAVNAFGPSAYSVGVSGTPVQPRYFYAWGYNNHGQLGQNDRVNRSSPVQVGAGTTWLNISSGSYFVLATKTDGTLWSWGKNISGQLGQNNTVDRSSPVQVGALTTWVSLGLSTNSVGAIKSDGTLWTWGANGSGQLGDSTNVIVEKSSPTQVGSLTNWSKISGADASFISIKTDGTLWAWGNNANGQLGQNNTISRSSPVQIGSLTNWANLANSADLANFCAAVKTDGTLWVWGRNNSGQLGQNNTTDYSSPVQVGSLTSWSKVSIGFEHSIMIMTNGTMWSMGNNSQGQLGQNDRVYRSSPVQIGALTTWSNSTASYVNSMATKTDGTLWAWGGNTNGQLGQNDRVHRSSPVQVGSATTWQNISLSTYASFAISN